MGLFQLQFAPFVDRMRMSMSNEYEQNMYSGERRVVCPYIIEELNQSLKVGDEDSLL